MAKKSSSGRSLAVVGVNSLKNNGSAPPLPTVGCVYNQEGQKTRVVQPPFLTVIIPAYNAEKTIWRCLESVDAALAKIDHEIIVVDDASNDETASIVEESTKIFSNLRLIRQEKNLGCGPARNRGLAEATGEFVWLIDADDVAVVENFRNFDIHKACEGRDVVMFPYNQVIPGKNGVQPWIEYDARVMAARPSDDFTAREFSSVLTTTNAAWNKFFRREAIIAAGMEFPATFVGDDLAFVVANLVAARRIGFVNRVLYTYRCDDSFISRVTDNRRLQILSALEIFENWLKQRSVSQEIWTSWNVTKAHDLLLTYKTTGKHTREVIKDHLETYLRSFDDEMYTRLMMHPFFRADMKRHVTAVRANVTVFEARAVAALRALMSSANETVDPFTALPPSSMYARCASNAKAPSASVTLDPKMASPPSSVYADTTSNAKAPSASVTLDPKMASPPSSVYADTTSNAKAPSARVNACAARINHHKRRHPEPRSGVGIQKKADACTATTGFLRRSAPTTRVSLDNGNFCRISGALTLCALLSISATTLPLFATAENFYVLGGGGGGAASDGGGGGACTGGGGGRGGAVDGYFDNSGIWHSERGRNYGGAGNETGGGGGGGGYIGDLADPEAIKNGGSSTIGSSTLPLIWDAPPPPGGPPNGRTRWRWRR